MPQMPAVQDEVLWAGGRLSTGKLVLLPATAVDPHDEAHATVIVRGDGSLRLRGADGADHIYLEATPIAHSGSILWIGGNGRQGDIVLLPKDAKNRDVAEATILLHGASGDIVFQNGDCAEEFELADEAEAGPGTVVIVDESGRVRPSAESYDRRVAGVVSGAGTARPAIVLNRGTSAAGRVAVALLGKVFCKVDARACAVGVGDLLTTSDAPGHAMRADDRRRAFGAVLGKALGSFAEGTGLIPVLVALQ